MATEQGMIPPARRSLRERLFVEHPRALGMTWAAHGIGAAKIGVVLVSAGLACVIHALVPGWFTHTAGKTVSNIHADMQRRKAGAQNPENWSDYEI